MDLDFTMPTVLLIVSLIAAFFNRRVEGRLKGVLEEREFRVRDALLLVGSISMTVLIIVWIPQLALMALFLFAYSTLLFMFTYLFSDFDKFKARAFCLAFAAVALVAGMALEFGLVANDYGIYGFLTFYGLLGFIAAALVYEQFRASNRERWYLALLPPALFICLYLFYGKTPLWFPYLLDLYGLVFAVLIILYIGSLFTWKTMLVFTSLLTVADIILVLGTKSMVSAATTVSGLRLPVLISLPVTPLVITGGGLQYMSLGLGDFFFAGLLGIQTWKKLGRKAALLSVAAMSTSFFIFESILLTYGPAAFPGTVMIIAGWLPLLLWYELKHRGVTREKDDQTNKRVSLTE